MRMEPPQPLTQILPTCGGGRRSCDANSPEFEFWMVRNPSFPPPNLLSADELFSDGFLLPLHLLQLSTEPPPPPTPPPQDGVETAVERLVEAEPSTTESAELPPASNSKQRRNIFKKKRADDQSSKGKKNGGGVSFGAGNVLSAAELNINIWPFSRSRSAGNGGTRPKAAPATRKVSSAPCSRSNSTGESKSRKWAHSPNRAGVHLGRNSPVWQVRRGGSRSSDALLKNAEKGGKRDANDGGRRKIPATKSRVLSLNVPMCIGYRNQLSCRHDESSKASVAAASRVEGGVAGEVVRKSNLFNIRSLFTKKVN